MTKKPAGTAHLRVAQMLSSIMESREDSLVVANSASTLLISRCNMLNINPYLSFLLLRDLCDRNVKHFISHSFEETERKTGIKLTPKLKGELEEVVSAMERLVMEGLGEKLINVKEE